MSDENKDEQSRTEKITEAIEELTSLAAFIIGAIGYIVGAILLGDVVFTALLSIMPDIVWAQISTVAYGVGALVFGVITFAFIGEELWG